MRKFTGDRAMTLGFVVLSFALALWQRPGQAMTDTKIDLHVDPVGVPGAGWPRCGPPPGTWARSTARSTRGYLWPMGPFFAPSTAIGVSPWVAQRLWLGVIFAVSAWGMLQADGRRRRPPARRGAPGGRRVLRAQPLHGRVHRPRDRRSCSATPRCRGCSSWCARRPRRCASPGLARLAGLVAPAAFALILTSIGGGINGAVVGWMLVGPLVLMVYEPLVGSVRWRDSAGLRLLRVGVLGAARLAVVDRAAARPRALRRRLPAVHRAAALDLGHQQRHRGAAPDGLLDVLLRRRLLRRRSGRSSASRRRCCSTRSSWARRCCCPRLPWRASCGRGACATRRSCCSCCWWAWPSRWPAFPSGTPIRHGMEWVYNEVFVLRFMRTTQKAAPLVAIGMAGLLGWAPSSPGRACARCAAAGPAAPRALVGGPLALAALIALAALPLTRGSAPDEQITWERIPAAWDQAGRDLDRELPRQRAGSWCCRGRSSPTTRWGGTVDSILPRLTDRPVAVRYETPYSDAHASDLLTTVDGLVQQRRLLPGQLPAAARPDGRAGGDHRQRRRHQPQRRGRPPPTRPPSWRARGCRVPRAATGRVRSVPPAKGELGPGPALPQVRRYDLPAGRGLVGRGAPGPGHDRRRQRAQGLAGLAAFGALPERRPIFYAGDLTARPAPAPGRPAAPTWWSRTRTGGARFIAHEHPAERGPDAAAATSAQRELRRCINPFPERGSDAETVAVLEGASYIRAPERGRPAGLPRAARRSPPSTATRRRCGRRPLPAPAPALARDRLRAAARRSLRRPPAHPRLARGREGGRRQRRARRSSARAHPRRARTGATSHGCACGSPRSTSRGGPQGIGRLSRDPHPRRARCGSRCARRSSPARALAGRDLQPQRPHLPVRAHDRRPAAFRRDRHTGSPLLELLSNRQDAEKQIERRGVRARRRARTRSTHGCTPSVEARDSALDRLAGLRRAGASTPRAASRTSRATAPRAPSTAARTPPGSSIWEPPSAPRPWISWSGAAAARRVAGCGSRRRERAIRRPTVVRLSWAGGATPPLRVGADGAVALPAPGPRARLPPDRAEGALPRGRDARASAPPARSASARSTVPGLRPGRAAPAGPLRAALRERQRSAWAGGEVPLRPRGTVADLDAGRPLRAARCGGPVRMGAGTQRDPHPARRLQRRPAAPALARAGVAAARVGRRQGGGRRAARQQLARRRDASTLDGPSWLVLGQSYSKGWRGDVRRALAGRAAADQRLRQRLAGAGRLPRRGLRLRAPGRRRAWAT